MWQAPLVATCLLTFLFSQIFFFFPASITSSFRHPLIPVDVSLTHDKRKHYSYLDVGDTGKITLRGLTKCLCPSRRFLGLLNKWHQLTFTMTVHYLTMTVIIWCHSKWKIGACCELFMQLTAVETSYQVISTTLGLSLWMDRQRPDSRRPWMPYICGVCPWELQQRPSDQILKMQVHSACLVFMLIVVMFSFCAVFVFSVPVLSTVTALVGL